MTTLSLTHKAAYEEIIERYLSGEATGEDTVSSFFEQRTRDNPIDASKFPEYPPAVASEWGELFSRLFNANEDVVFGDPAASSGTFPITETEFKQELSEILPLSQEFSDEPVPHP